MKNKQIYFTAVHKAELAEYELREITSGELCVRMIHTVISGGTERACIMGMQNTSQKFPMSLGYCGVGIVEKTGESVKKFKVGDRVLVYHGCHAKYNIVTEDQLTLVGYDNITSLEAAFVVIAAMGLGGVRKLELELGESAMVMGLGLLGIFSVQFLRNSGALPLIACDLSRSRRELALRLGADHALDPSEDGFTERVKELTGGVGVKACVEVTGSSLAMSQALECASWMGRIALLGCTRVSDVPVDYYTKVHKPGVKLIGAHNFVRPKHDSYPHHWTHHDDCRAILEMIARKRIEVEPIVSRIESPENAEQLYNELCDDRDFKIGTVFDWSEI